MLEFLKTTAARVKSSFFPKKTISKVEFHEELIKRIDDRKLHRARKLAKKIKRPQDYTSAVSWWSDADELANIYGEAYESLLKDPKITKRMKSTSYFSDYDYPSQQNIPASMSFYDDFSNVFEIYDYLHKNHPVVFRCMDIIREELSNDGFYIKHYKGTPKREIKALYNQIRDHKVDTLRLDIAVHLKLYGNAWMLPEKDRKTGKTKLRLLNPQKIKAIMDPETNLIIGWRYQQGKGWKDYGLDKIYHLALFNSNPDEMLGTPPLQPALLDVEIDLAIKQYCKQVMEKGFLGSVVFSIKSPDTGGDPLEDDSEAERLSDIRDMINSELTGASAGGAPLVMSDLEKVADVSPVGKFENPFGGMSKEKSKLICMCIGIPSEKISISRSESVQYVPSFVEYSVNVSFDKSIYYLVNLVDQFLNDVYLRDLNDITSMRIEASGRYGSLTKTAAEVINILASAGPIITVNQALSIILGWEELPPENPRGHYVLDNTKGRMEGLNSSEVPRYPELIDPEQEDLRLEAGKPSAKKVSWDKFFEYANEIREERNIKSGKHERKELTYAGDEEICTAMLIRAGRPERFFRETIAA